MPISATSTFQPGTAKLDPVFPNGPVRTINVNLVAGTYVRGQVLGELTATPGKYKAYLAANTDGSQVAKGLLQYSCVVDATGNVTLAGEFGQTQFGVPMILGGGHVFDTTQLTSLDAAAVTQLGASLIEGGPLPTAGLLRY